MARIRPATFVLEPGVYKDKLPPCHVVEMRCDMPDREPYEKMKRDFMVELGDFKRITALSAAAVTTKEEFWEAADIPGTLQKLIEA